MHLDNALCDRKTQSRTHLGLGDRAVQLLEFLEDFRLIRVGDAGAGVAHGECKRLLARRDFDRHLALVGELDRVADEVEKSLREPTLVAARRRQAGGHDGRKRQLLFRGERLDRAVNSGHQFVDRVFGERQIKLARLDLRQIENVVDKAEQMLSVALHAFKRPAHSLRNFAVDAIKHQFAEAEDRIKRRPQLMAHVGQELRLVPTSILETLVELP